MINKSIAEKTDFLRKIISIATLILTVIEKKSVILQLMNSTGPYCSFPSLKDVGQRPASLSSRIVSLHGSRAQALVKQEIYPLVVPMQNESLDVRLPKSLLGSVDVKKNDGLL